ncbi:MAG: hypothetical protein JXK07_04100 [Spirochaetes bacterium]|nr:hypothetical protein [Spirochaetota bacterium]MBN2770378.1 hypothetical protein [Spirochaetota bacterium]
MTKFKILILLTLLAQFATLSASTEISFSGEAEIRAGVESKKSDNKTSRNYGIPARESGILFNSEIASGNITGLVSLEINTDGVTADSASLSYNLGIATLTYEAAGIDQRWNDDMLYSGSADGNAFTVSLFNLGFISIIGLKSEREESMENYTSERAFPIISGGLDGELAGFELKLGAVYGQNSDDTNWLLFSDTSTQFGDLSLGFGLTYGKNCGIIVDEDDIINDSTLISLILSAEYAFGSFIPGIEGMYAVKSINDEGDYSAYSINPYMRYEVDENLAFSLGVIYESQSVVADDKDIDPDKITTVYTSVNYTF